MLSRVISTAAVPALLSPPSCVKACLCLALKGRICMMRAMASTRLDFPDPFLPTITLIPGCNSNSVVSKKDLNPSTRTLVMCIDTYLGFQTRMTISLKFETRQFLKTPSSFFFQNLAVSFHYYVSLLLSYSVASRLD